MKNGKKMGEPAFQHRITIDEGMGEMYWWLRQKSSSIRPREMLFLMRVGFEARAASGAASVNPAEKPTFAAPEEAPARHSRPAETLNRDVSVASSLNLGALCKPLAPSSARVN